MSSFFARRVTCLDFERRWVECHRAAKVHDFERREILSGDYGPIVRELEPAFEEGQEFVLRWERAQRQALYDIYDPLKLTGDVVRVPRQPLFTITIKEKKRNRLGAWVVHFDVWRQDAAAPLIRRKPPSLVQGDYEEPTPEEIAKASVESNYTHNPKQAVDHLPSVPSEYHNVLSMQAKTRHADHRRLAQADDEAEADVRAINAELRQLAKRAVKLGLDPTLVMAPVVREISAQHAELSKAA